MAADSASSAAIRKGGWLGPSPQRGYGISQAINATSREAFKVETGSLSPALHRLERRGWATSEWRTSDNHQRAKYYELTVVGRKHLSSERSRWAQCVGAMTSLMAGPESPPCVMPGRPASLRDASEPDFGV